MILHVPEGFAESLEVDDLTLSQEADRIADFRVFDHTEDVLIGGAGFLLCRQVLEQIRDGIALGLEFTGVEGNAAGCLRPDTGSVVDIVGSEAGGLDLLRSQVSGQLMDDGGHDLQMGQFLRTCIGIEMLPLI